MLRHCNVKPIPDNDKSRCLHLKDFKAIIYFKNANSASKENAQVLPWDVKPFHFNGSKRNNQSKKIFFFDNTTKCHLLCL